jgi:hypothetical protein
MALLRDMLFSILFVGDEPLIREIVLGSAHRLGAKRDMAQVHAAGLLRLRVLFFLLMDRDVALKEKLLDGWKEMCVPGVDAGKAARFFSQLGPEIIEPWLIDERKTEGDFINAVTDLYLVS